MEELRKVFQDLAGPDLDHLKTDWISQSRSVTPKRIGNLGS